MTVLDQGQQSSAIYQLVNAEPYTAAFNDPTSSDYVGGLSGDDGISGLDSPEVREAAKNLVEADGGVHGNFWFGRRPVTITAEVLGSSVAEREALLERARRASNCMRQDGQLIWFPGDPAIVATTRQNLIADPSFEYDTALAVPGLGVGGTLPWTNISDAQWTSVQFYAEAVLPLSGTKALRVAGTKDANVTSRFMNIRSALMPVVTGRTYSAKAQPWIADAGSQGSYTVIHWWDANGVALGAFSASNNSGAATGRVTLTTNGAVAPATAAYASLDLVTQSNVASDVADVRWDALQFVEEATAGAYFDGDTANSSWMGLRGFTPSTNRPNGRFVSVRRQQPFRVSGIGWKKSIFVPLIAADPRIYSTAQYRPVIAPATNLNVDNQGDAESPPVLRVNGPGTNPTVRCTSNGVQRNITFTGLTLAANQYVEIDVLDRTVKRETGASVYGNIDFLNTSWWGIMPGPSNTLRLDWASGSTAASTLDPRWRDAWV